VRVDSGVEQGDEISPYYDPMIAKLIVWDRDRASALARMRKALAEYRVVGVANNVEFLARLTACPSFSNAVLDTSLIEREQSNLFPPAGLVPETVWLLASLAELLHEARPNAPMRPLSPWESLDGWRLNGHSTRTIVLRQGDQHTKIAAKNTADGWLLSGGGDFLSCRGSLRESCEIHAQIGERRVHATVVAAGERRQVFFEGRTWALTRVDNLYTGGEGEDHSGSLRAPMPGKIVALLAQAGATVEKGTPLLVMEAMKMEHTIAAPCKGVLKSFHCSPGDQVNDGIELVEFEAAS
jgi:3-methylcrotonyl-CoA carboxylase alpha subunit